MDSCVIVNVIEPNHYFKNSKTPDIYTHKRKKSSSWRVLATMN